MREGLKNIVGGLRNIKEYGRGIKEYKGIQEWGKGR